ncbi:phosphotransferase [Arthrobacter oryzae]|uniref:Aminoglycoside/choline kinase family phosphotransferase n=1 Tax=Arthrobacter oryzae TaxID=409290 RepID=A0A495E7C3_9MICC|nr:phosphotransferase [Arthrobacter oryzae]RKR12696.1 aminoglycoside/choline kinase family phosphotransferase [Arthrobacter oryzae]
MSWHPPVPRSAVDSSGQTWRIHRVWPDSTVGDYILEVVAPGQAGVQGGVLRGGAFELLSEDDPGLPSLRAEARHGELVSYRPHMRAVVRTDAGYIKVFPPGGAIVPAERCAQTELLLAPGTFTAPRVLRNSPDVIVFSAVPGRPLGDLGDDTAGLSDGELDRLWERWQHAWTAQVGSTAGHAALAALPVHSPEVEVADLRRWVNRWLRHHNDIPEASTQRDALSARADEVTRNLLRTAPDPLVWAHGDLHDKQILAAGGSSPLGLLDFDDTAQAEAALDLANLDVHLELGARVACISPDRYVAAHTRILAAAEELHVSPDRFHAYSDGVWLRLACSPFPKRSARALAVLDERAAHIPLASGYESGPPVLLGRQG